jgi:hypothetical protein
MKVKLLSDRVTANGVARTNSVIDLEKSEAVRLIKSGGAVAYRENDNIERAVTGAPERASK